MSKTTIESSKYTEDWLPIKNITNGMIVTDSNYYVGGVKISPRNILILEEGMQNNIMTSLSNFYNTIDFEFWLLVADRPVDIQLYQSKLLMLYNNSTDNAVRKLIMQDIEKANQFSGPQFNIVDTEYFMLFKDKQLDVVQKRIYNSISGLAASGLNAVQTTNDDMRMILDNFLNDGTQVTFGGVM